MKASKFFVRYIPSDPYCMPHARYSVKLLWFLIMCLFGWLCWLTFFLNLTKNVSAYCPYNLHLYLLFTFSWSLIFSVKYIKLFTKALVHAEVHIDPWKTPPPCQIVSQRTKRIRNLIQSAFLQRINVKILSHTIAYILSCRRLIYESVNYRQLNNSAAFVHQQDNNKEHTKATYYWPFMRGFPAHRTRNHHEMTPIYYNTRILY